jgi:hypothetical protein
MTVEEVVRRLTPGRSFVDVGGLWGTVNERVSTALLAGATAAAMVDVTPLDHPLWQAFAARCAERGVAPDRYRRVHASLDDPRLPDMLGGPQDVVHCSGVLYHCPDPFGALRQLARLARRHVVVGSTTVPERIENGAGVVEFGEGRVVAVPALSGRTRAVVARHFADAGMAVHNINRPEPHPWLWPDGSWNYAPWWWLWSAGTLRAMAEAAGLRVLEVFETWPGRSHALVCEVPPPRAAA